MYNHSKTQCGHRARTTEDVTESQDVVFGFTYQPLDDPSKDLRLLRVLPERSNDCIQVQLWNCPAQEIASINYPGYHCLSYTWGNPADTHEIRVNGQSLRVRRNLHDFLNQASKTMSSHVLWIDALCIDQNALHEKNVQVAKMGSVYNGAIGVLAWVGTDKSFLLLARYISGESSRYPEVSESGIEASYAAFWAHPYWTRTWITQELLMAKSIHVLIGTYTLAWQSFDRVFEPAFQLTHTIPHAIHHDMNSKFFDFVKHRHEYATGSHDIWDILRWRAHTECSISNDRIYALLALVQGGRTFDVRYGEEPRDLFWRAGEHFQAWAHVAYMAQLSTALRLSTTELAADIRVETKSDLIRLRVSHVHIPSIVPWRSTGPACPGCGHPVIRPHVDEVVFCTKPGTASAAIDYEMPFTHVVVRRRSNMDPTDRYHVSLVNGSTIAGYDVPPGALRYRVNGKWATARDHTHFRKKLKEKRLQPVGRNWAVFVPREYVVHCLGRYGR